jgi:hypothetical protein
VVTMETNCVIHEGYGLLVADTFSMDRVIISRIYRVCVCVCVCIYICVYIYIYTGCNRRNVPYFGRVFLMLNYTEKTQNTYIQS